MWASCCGTQALGVWASVVAACGPQELWCRGLLHGSGGIPPSQALNLDSGLFKQYDCFDISQKNFEHLFWNIILNIILKHLKIWSTDIFIYISKRPWFWSSNFYILSEMGNNFKGRNNFVKKLPWIYLDGIYGLCLHKILGVGRKKLKHFIEKVYLIWNIFLSDFVFEELQLLSLVFSAYIKGVVFDFFKKIYQNPKIGRRERQKKVLSH